jgi:uncharacterized protein YuzE
LSIEDRKEFTIKDVDKLWLEYDIRNDILYINFGYDIEDADEELLLENDVVVRVKNNRVVGITIFNFSSRIGHEII